MKKLIILALIAVSGLALRIYNLDFPSIGYHDMRENESLSIAKEMSRTGDFFSKRVYFQNAFGDVPGAIRNKELPLVPWQTVLAWRIFGENLWGARLVNVFFGVLSVIAIYLIAGCLFSGMYPALLCAFIAAISPLLIFFSRNLQPDAPAFFFMLLGSLFYLRFLTKGFKKYNLLLGGAAFALSGLYQCNFLIGIAPFLFFCPREILGKEPLKFALALLGPYLVFGVIALVLTAGYEGVFYEFAFSRINEIASLAYWKKYAFTIWRYATAENFTLVFVLFALLGTAVALPGLKSVPGRYLLGWIPAMTAYFLIFPQEITRQSYFQMPFAAFICLAIGYLFSWLKRHSRNILLVFLAAAMIGVNAGFIFQAVRGMHWTVFLGLDVAGESLKEFTKPDERAFLYGHPQGNGIARYAQRYMGWPEGLEDFKRKEDKLGIRYICFYPIEYAHILRSKDSALFNYIESAYRAKEIGYAEDASRPVYIILEKGRAEGEKSFLDEFGGHSQLRTIYRMFGRYVFFYAVRS